MIRKLGLLLAFTAGWLRAHGGASLASADTVNVNLKNLSPSCQ